MLLDHNLEKSIFQSIYKHNYQNFVQIVKKLYFVYEPLPGFNDYVRLSHLL